MDGVFSVYFDKLYLIFQEFHLIIYGYSAETGQEVSII